MAPAFLAAGAMADGATSGPAGRRIIDGATGCGGAACSSSSTSCGSGGASLTHGSLPTRTLIQAAATHAPRVPELTSQKSEGASAPDSALCEPRLPGAAATPALGEGGSCRRHERRREQLLKHENTNLPFKCNLKLVSGPYNFGLRPTT